jgi:hypothetical protein
MKSRVFSHPVVSTFYICCTPWDSMRNCKWNHKSETRALSYRTGLRAVDFLPSHWQSDKEHVSNRFSFLRHTFTVMVLVCNTVFLNWIILRNFRMSQTHVHLPLQSVIHLGTNVTSLFWMRILFVLCLQVLDGVFFESLNIFDPVRSEAFVANKCIKIFSGDQQSIEPDDGDGSLWNVGV